MTSAAKSREELLTEIETLRFRLEEAEDTLRAIGSGEVDAFVVSGPDGEQVFTLKGSEQPYRILVETMNDGAVTLAADGSILYCNNRLAAMLQVPLETIIGTQLGSYVAPADRPLFTARLEKCAQVCATDEIAMMTGAGNFVPVLISCCTHDFSGSRGISMVVTDLSEQKRNEEIVASEKLARSIIEQAGEAIVVCDEEGMVIRASRLAHQLCTENPLLKPFDKLFPLRITERERLFSVFTPLHGGCLESIEVEFKRSGDQLFHLLLNATPLKSAQDRIIGCVMTLTDITERREAEEALRESEARLQATNEELQAQSEELQAQSEELQAQSEELQAQSEELQAQNQELSRLWEVSRRAEEALKKLNAELENRVAERTAELAANIEKLKVETVERVRAVEALREKDQILIQQSRQAAMGEMIGNIAHQWRQPLNALGLTIQQLLLLYDLGEFTREVLDQSVSSSMDLIQHMSRTIDDFRNYFRPDREKVEFNVREVIVNTLSLLEGSLQNPQIGVEIFGKDEPVIYGYPNEFAQVLLNILINARDAFTERETDNPTVTFTICSEDGSTVVTVADNAGGIPEEIVGKVFDPYFTTKGPHRGTGVGLFMSKTIIEKSMGGRLTVRNIANGAEFRIEVWHGIHA